MVDLERYSFDGSHSVGQWSVSVGSTGLCAAPDAPLAERASWTMHATHLSVL